MYVCIYLCCIEQSGASKIDREERLLSIVLCMQTHFFVCVRGKSAVAVMQSYAEILAFQYAIKQLLSAVL